VLAIELVITSRQFREDVPTRTPERTRQGTSAHSAPSDSSDNFNFYLGWWLALLIVWSIADPFAKLFGDPDLTLPTVHITRIAVEDGNPENSETTINKGSLLTHSEGFWYVFNNKGTLIAIPDAEVERVSVSPKSN
jgi:hypothetical protein